MDPPDFGPQLKVKIKERLRASKEGYALGNVGYIVYITEIKDENISRGRIEDSTGQVMYHVTFDAIVFRPFKNEVLDTIVGVSHDQGFFCHAGPLRIFVSRHAMPDDLKDGFDQETSAWVSDDKQVEIKAGCGVRLRLMNVKIEQNEITAVGTINDDYLGLVISMD